MLVQLDKINKFDEYTSYTFDLSPDAYYPAPVTDYCDDLDQIFTITVFLELEPERNFDTDIVCENCENTSAPYFWFHDYFGMHSCLSHLPLETQTQILAAIAQAS